ncbi:MAG: carboxypeptidase regulatory-like domain-containing protein [Myxococcales bacterium]|nr:carboxypeptidase regulatory-like domain-containing protein [Myxococcales bacterium]
MKTHVAFLLGALVFAGTIASACGSSERERASFEEDASAGGDTSGGLGSGSLVGHDSRAPVGCKNLECKQLTCADGKKTTVSGVVYAPTPPELGKPDPIYNAILYVPNDALQPFPVGVSCDKCGAIASGEPIATALSAADGKFVLENVPVGEDIPLVIQVGRWRREVKIPKVEECTDTPLDAELTRLPRNKSEGDIPLMAIVTSAFDATECLMRKIGVADSEFTTPDQDGRIHIYRGSGAKLPTTPPTGSALWGSKEQLAKYDVVALPCGSQPTSAEDRQNIIDYTNSGGRVFITDLSQDAIKDGPAPWPSTANFVAAGTYINPASVDTTFPKGAALADWLQTISATTTKGQLNLTGTYARVSSVNPPSQRWIYSSTTAQTYSFNTPVGAEPEEQCGRAFYSSFHVTTGAGGTFPRQCSNAPMTAQEKALEFMLFDLSACVQKDDTRPEPPPVK